MVVTLRLNRRPDAVQVCLSPLAELMACLHVLAEPDHHPEARSWLPRATARIDDRLGSEVSRFAPLWARYRSRLLFPFDRLERDLGAELDNLDRLPEELFTGLAADAIRGHALPRDENGRLRPGHKWVHECETRSFVRGDLAHALVHHPGRFRQELSALLARCRTAFFDDHWQRCEPALRHAAADIRRQLAQGTDPVELITSLIPIATPRDTPDTVYFDKLQQVDCTVGSDGLLLIPSLRTTPHVIVKTNPGLPLVVHFPAQHPTSTLPSQATLQRQLRVLSEPVRWELCRHLIAEPITTGELTVHTGMTKYAVSQHLRVLRESGLVQSLREGRHVYHRVDAARIAALGHEVLRTIIR